MFKKLIICILVLTTFKVSLSQQPEDIVSAEELEQKTEDTGYAKRKSIAIFKVNLISDTTNDYILEILNKTERIVTKTFRSLGRFNIEGVAKELNIKDVEKFAETVIKLRGKNAKQIEKIIGKKVERYGMITITAEELEKFAQSFLIVIPTLRDVSIVKSKSGTEYLFEISGALDIGIVNVEKGKYERIETIYSVGTAGAFKNALDYFLSFLADGLEFEVKNYLLRTEGEIKAERGKVILNVGEDLGLEVGDEFVVMQEKKIGDFSVMEEKGLVRVSYVGDNFSEVQLLTGDVENGDRVQEQARYHDRFISMSLTPYSTTNLQGEDTVYYGWEVNFGIQSSGKFLFGVYSIFGRYVYGRPYDKAIEMEATNLAESETGTASPEKAGLETLGIGLKLGKRIMGSFADVLLSGGPELLIPVSGPGMVYIPLRFQVEAQKRFSRRFSLGVFLGSRTLLSSSYPTTIFGGVSTIINM